MEGEGATARRFTAVGFLFNLALASFPRVAGADVVRHLLFVAVFACFALPFVAGFLHGRFHPSSAEPRLDHLRATLPLSDRNLAWLQITAALRAVGACWMVMFGSALTTLAWLATLAEPGFVPNLWAQVREVSTSLPLSTLAGAAIVFAVWTLAGTGLTASLVLTGRNWLIAALAQLPALIVVALLVERITGFSMWQAFLPLVGGVSFLLPVAVLGAAQAGARRGLLSPRLTLRILVIWFGLSVCTAIYAQTFDPRGRLAELLLFFPANSEIVAAFAFWAGAVLPWLLAPLAVHWNRHR